MSIHYLRPLVTAAVFLSVGSAYAGPCSPELDRMQASLDTMVAAAAPNPPGRQSTAAMTHRQPTPSSVAAAEAKLEEAGRTKRALDAMARARAADRAGDASVCQQALAEARREIGQ